MNLITIIAMAVALSLDSFAVAITGGIYIRPLQFKQALKIALVFGIFQALMPVIGWLAGVTMATYIASYDHWVAFVLLAFIGGRMIHNSLSGVKGGVPMDLLKNATLLMLAIATSIDALAIGISFALLDVSILKPIIYIGMITFIFTLTGVYVGNRVGGSCEKKFELIGGVILILIGIKILWEHLL